MEYTLIGLLVGVVIGMTGVGGTTITTPLLLLIGVQPLIAVGTNLTFAFISKCAALALYWRKQNINWRIVLLLCTGSVPLSIFMTSFLMHADEAVTNDLIEISVGSIVAITAVFLFVRSFVRFKKPPQTDENIVIRVRFTPFRIFMSIFFGALIGILVTLTSIGAGVITLIIILWLYPKLNITTIVGTDLVHALIITLIAGIGHLFLNHMDASLLGWLLVGSLPGVGIGYFIATRVSERIIRRLIALLLFGIGASMLVNNF